MYLNHDGTFEVTFAAGTSPRQRERAPKRARRAGTTEGGLISVSYHVVALEEEIPSSVLNLACSPS